MQARAHCHIVDDEISGDFDRRDFLSALGELRGELQSMGSDMRDVLRENEELRETVNELKQRRRVKSKQSEMHRLKRECLDGLEHLHELASVTREKSRQASTRSDPVDSGLGEGGPWLKKMMMMMMVAEMV